MLLMVNTAVLAVLLVILVVAWAFMPAPQPIRTEEESEIDQIKHHVELEGEQEAMEELMPYKPPRLDSPRQRKRL